MEHRTIPTDNDSLAGGWWEDGATKPFSTWSFDKASRVLTSQHHHHGHEEVFADFHASLSDEELIDRISQIALLRAKDLAQR